MLWKNLCLKIYENDNILYYKGVNEILMINKKNIKLENKDIKKFIKKTSNIPANAKVAQEDFNDWWVYRYYSINQTQGHIHIIDYGFSEKAYSSSDFLNWYLYYKTSDILVDKREKNYIKITYNSSNYFNAFNVIWGYLSDTNSEISVVTQKTISDEIDLIIFLKENTHIEIELKSEDYEMIKSIRVNIEDHVL